MKYYVIAGELSGDLQGAALVRALKDADNNAVIRCWGGELMAAEGAEVAMHYRELAFMGFLEVVKNLPAILRNFRFAKTDIKQFAPDCLILIDYPGFNLRMATWAKKQGLRVFYYISPQLWAWHTSRVKIVRDCVERMFVIFPFEADFYKKHGVEVSFIGHPLAAVVERHEAAKDFHSKNKLTEGKPIVALLPGSRRQEVARMLATMLEVSTFFPDYQFVVAKAPSLELAFYETYLADFPSVKLVEHQTYDLLENAHAALVTSGTATLETALFKVPQVVCYKAGGVSYHLARWLVNKDLKFISIVNLIAGNSVVEELIQNEFTVEKTAISLRKILEEKGRFEVLEGYQAMRKLLGPSDCAERAAYYMVAALER
ncbi:MAG: lipid-A-disaccharide synthase [Saprospiraceae bacterium]|nr:lipid-A-disaccharide synthase [Saprospiraceae bacterium]MCF8252480.1 lipid-A-disaccharide synthase [Saprospiraceae bacterium]MCF8282481.1 lipid-A-disaccharide synthase [Bacteroidales bacterium]MCF8312653.1 lipid-A-disaccharide synthase [Saprospiraceae bacterium]MCF8441081.1 lipid-A-disaccharide synthase [Saprospiraceae bacterium]